MYVCIEVALRGIAHGKGRSNWAKGRDPSESWVQYPNPAVPAAPRHSRWNVLMHFRAFSEPTLLWAAKGVLSEFSDKSPNFGFLHYGRVYIAH